MQCCSEGVRQQQRARRGDVAAAVKSCRCVTSPPPPLERASACDKRGCQRRQERREGSAAAERRVWQQVLPPHTGVCVVWRSASDGQQRAGRRAVALSGTERRSTLHWSALEKMRAHAVVAAACSRCALALHLLFVSPSFTALLSLVEVVTRGRRIESTNLTKAHAIHEGPTDLLLRTGKEKQDNHNRKRKREREK